MLVFILIGILRVKYSGKFCSPTFASLNFTLLAIFVHHVLLGWSCALELLKNELGIIKTCNLDLMWILRYIQTHMNFAWFPHILLHPLSSYTHIFSKWHAILLFLSHIFQLLMQSYFIKHVAYQLRVSLERLALGEQLGQNGQKLHENYKLNIFWAKQWKS